MNEDLPLPQSEGKRTVLQHLDDWSMFILLGIILGEVFLLNLIE